MVNSRDEQIDPMAPTTKLKPPPKKQTKGNRHDANKDILKYFNQLVCDDHKMYPTLGHIMWQANTLMNVTLTNFVQHKGMPLMSTTMLPIFVNIKTKV
jgi:hypothetical protein